MAVLAFLVACRSAPATDPLPKLEELPPNILPTTARVNGAVRYVDLVVGTGELAEERKCVLTHYTGYLTDGSRFESSRDSSASSAAGSPIPFVIGGGQVIKGWELGVVGMRIGGTRRLFIPARLGYGARGSLPVVPRNADLIFDVELLGVGRSSATRQGTLVCAP